MSEMVERVARKLCQVQGYTWLTKDEADREGNFCDDDYRQQARMVIKAMREPTEAMVSLAADIATWEREVGELSKADRTLVSREVYAAMMDAALAPTDLLAHTILSPSAHRRLSCYAGGMGFVDVYGQLYEGEEQFRGDIDAALRQVLSLSVDLLLAKGDPSR